MTADPHAPVDPEGPTEPNDLSDEDFHALYGPIETQTPASVTRLFAGAPFRWWLVGGWALEVATREAREHDDLDVSVFVTDLPDVRRWAAAEGLDVWLPHPDGLRPLLTGERCPEDREQIWLRRGASAPWLVDLLLNPTDAAHWVFKKDHRIRRPIAQAIGRAANGVEHLAPELVLLHKAHLVREKDETDFGATVPLLDADARAWLRDALATAYPGHEWIGRL